MTMRDSLTMLRPGGIHALNGNSLRDAMFLLYRSRCWEAWSSAELSLQFILGSS
jgi:hypothetical protein